ncbi:hypothetical protein IJJ08_03370 [bacterium]|nr:hypothetical protein [bacterium]
MNRLIRHLFIFLASVLVVLLIVRLIQSSQEEKLSQQQQLYEYELRRDRARADDLYYQLQNLKQLRDTLVVPQIELSIKL